MFTACDAPATEEGTDAADTTVVADDAAGDVDATQEQEEQVAPEEETTEVEGTETEGTEGEATEGEEATETTEAE